MANKSKTPSRHPLPWLAAGAVVLVWSLCSIIIEGASLGDHALAFGALRAVIASIAVSMAAFVGGELRPPKGSIATLALIGLTGVTIPMAGMFMSVPGAGSTLAGLLGNLQAIVTLPLAYLVLREPLSARQVFGVVFGSTGAAWLVASRGFEGAALEGAAWALASSIGNAISAVLYKRIHTKVHVLTVTAWQYILGSIPLVLLMAFRDFNGPSAWSGVGLSAVLFLGLVGSAGASVVWLHLLKRLPIVSLTAMTLLVPALAGFWGWAIYGFAFSNAAAMAIVMLLAGVVLAGLPLRPRNDAARLIKLKSQEI